MPKKTPLSGSFPLYNCSHFINNQRYHSNTIAYLQDLLKQERLLIRRYRWRYYHGSGVSLLHSLEFHKHIGARDLLKKLIKDLQKGPL